jgi:hypothetical protein
LRRLKKIKFPGRFGRSGHLSVTIPVRRHSRKLACNLPAEIAWKGGESDRPKPVHITIKERPAL